MKIVIAGGSGHLGTLLARSFYASHDVVVLSRRDQVTPWRTVRWDGEDTGPWTDEINGADVVINLAGRSVDCRYNARNRDGILRSRVASTEVLGKAIGMAAQPPHVWLQASTATIYAHRFDDANDEDHGILGGGFSVDVAKAWERAVDEARTPRTRKVKMRTAIVMSPEKGGPFDVLLRLVRYGLGGRAGDGRQFVSWVHHEDFVRAVRFLIDRPFVDGPVNIASPHPLPNAEFMEALRKAWGIRFGLPAHPWMLEIGAMLLRTETELILKSRRAVPMRLVRYGFRFDQASWPEAARALCAEWRALHGQPAAAPRAEAAW